MADDRWRRTEAFFAEAALLPPAERPAFLARACGEDLDLRREVESLLAADEQADAFLARPAISTPIPPPALLAGQLVGRYRLEALIGEGGMGSVYRAVRADEDYEQKVALKVLRHGAERADSAARFRRERQILAALDHPGLARLLDGGTTEAGQPYLVMEYIEGEAIDRYCDRHRLGIEARIDLFRQVCATVQYAHQNLVVHRDIKPANILVTADGVPRLLDFGIAKLLEGAALPPAVESTLTGQRLMTPQYASPEQVEGSVITTATDVYSLGVLLYVLLTGHLPYALPANRQAAIERAVLEADPEPPSTAIGRATSEPGPPADRVAAQAPAPEAVSTARRLRPQQLRRKLRGDLDNIVLMALRKDPERRYASVELLAEDLRRYRAGQPVLARPDTLAYRTRKFLGRHRFGTGAAAAGLAIILGLAVTMSVQAVRLADQRDRLRVERDKALETMGFLEEVFAATDPSEARGETVTAREILDRGAARVLARLKDQLEAQAALALAIGRVYLSLGLNDRALPLLEQSLAQRRKLHGDSHPDVADSLLGLSVLDQNRGAFAAAEAAQRQALDIQRKLLGKDHPKVGDTLTDLGVTLLALAKYGEAEEAVRQALAIHRQVPGVHEDVAYDLNNLGSVLRRTGKLAEAEAAYREALAVARSVFGPAHQQLTRTINNLAVVLMDQGDPAGAEPLGREALEMTRKLYGSEHPDIALQLSNLGSVVGARGDDDGWIDLARQALEMRRKLFGPDHEQVAMSLDGLGRALEQKQDYAAARPLYEEALRIQRQVYGNEHPRVADVLGHLAELLLAQGDAAGAEPPARASLEIRRKTLGEDHADAGWSLLTLGSIRLAAGSAEEAEQLLRRGLAVLAKGLPASHWRSAEARSRLGACLAARGKAAEAEALLVEGHEGLRRGRGAANVKTRAALARLIAFYEGQGNHAAAAAYRAQAPP